MLQARSYKAQDAQVVRIRSGADAAESGKFSRFRGCNTQDPPSAVARLNYMRDRFSFQPVARDWVDAVLNRPLVTGDNLWRMRIRAAEVHIGSTAPAYRPKMGLHSRSERRAAQIRLAQGSLIVKARRVDDEDSYEIDRRIWLRGGAAGDYRIDVNEDGSRTEVTVGADGGESPVAAFVYRCRGANSRHSPAAARCRHLDYDHGQIPDSGRI